MECRKAGKVEAIHGARQVEDDCVCRLGKNGILGEGGGTTDTNIQA